MDDLYRDYVNRVVRMTLPEQYQTQTQNIQPSAKFRRDAAGQEEALAFPGYTITTPPWADDPANEATYKGLSAFVQTLRDRLPSGLLATVPDSSFHMTLADLIWDANYRLAKETGGFDAKLRDRITESFAMYQSYRGEPHPCDWQVLGPIVMPRAIAVCLAPKNEAAYDRVIKLRRAIYQNSSLMALGIEQQYHFTAHITLGYFTQEAVSADKAELAQTITDLHQSWLDSDYPKDFQVHRADLRHFDAMTAYTRESDWPQVEI